MLHTLSPKLVATLAEQPDQNMSMLAVGISHASPCIGRSVKDIQLPRGSLLVALQHKYKAKVPAADDTILAGDRVVVFVNYDQVNAIIRSLVYKHGSNLPPRILTAPEAP